MQTITNDPSFVPYTKPTQKISEFIALGVSYTAGTSCNGNEEVMGGDAIPGKWPRTSTIGPLSITMTLYRVLASTLILATQCTAGFLSTEAGKLSRTRSNIESTI
ncbi:hypothetical protein ACN38_g8923 [Penicillium nordicum]|uniref:Uncharacterized protein n=1 Tax=Penicillium nordicum TaxID=229535 RepID=A0A0M8P4H1_9EURO|nr:hypothetical protein ACN38_g8923 [Penicillium nordicum]